MTSQAPSRPLAPHVQAAIHPPRLPASGAVQAGLPATPAPPATYVGAPAPHVRAAVERCHRPSQPPAPVQPTNAGRHQATPAAQPRAASAPADRASAGGGAGPPPPGSSGAQATAPATDFVDYEDRKTSTSPPPPPKRPIYALSCDDDGKCMIHDVKTGRIREAGDIFGGFVRMEKGGKVYLSPRSAVGVQGDSHPTIAAATPEAQGGRKALVAAGELGILDSEIVGHSDKTGHYQTRKNLRQSGLPAEKFHPFTVDPSEWYKRK